MAELTLSVTHTINAPIEFVFNAWLDPVIMAKFMMPAPDMSVSNVSTEPVIGGGFALTMNTAENNSIDHKGEYLEIDRHSKLVFTWLSPMSIDGSTVTLNLSEVEGGTHIELSQIKFISEEMRDNHIGGWASILKCLDKNLT